MDVQQASHLHLHIVAPTTVVENEDTEDDSEEDLSDHDSERSPTPDFPSPLAADRTANGHLLKCRPNTPVVWTWCFDKTTRSHGMMIFSSSCCNHSHALCVTLVPMCARDHVPLLSNKMAATWHSEAL